MNNKNKCTHGNVEMIGLTVIDGEYMEHLIVEYSEKCIRCGEIIGTERHRYKFDTVVFVSDDSN